MEEAITRSNVKEADFGTYLGGVYMWMFAGLVVSGLVSYFLSKNVAILQIFFGSIIPMLILFGLQIGLVVFLAARITKMSANSARILFLVYAALLGITLSYIFLAYSASSIASVFFITAGMFLSMSIVGFVTKKDLTKLGGLLIMALIGIIIAIIVNFFLHSSVLQIVISFIGVAVFLGLTAYDTQKIKKYYAMSGADGRLQIMSALQLYLDFINLFLFMLELFGGNK